MLQRVVIYARKQTCQTRPATELSGDLRRIVEGRGDIVTAIYTDGDALAGRGRYSGWKALFANLNDVDQIALATIGDIPCRTVADLLRILATIRDHGVGLQMAAEDIDTGSGSAFTVLTIIEAYRRAKVSEAIKAGQRKALAAGKRVGRPMVPIAVRRRIQMALADGEGIRRTAKKYGVSPGSVVNIRRTMPVDIEAETLAA
jgi:hypothetical protein